MAFDDRFTHDPHADLPYERDFTGWLEGAALVSATWSVDHPSLLETHDDGVSGNIARVWLRGKGRGGKCLVRCHFTADDGRSDERSWQIRVQNR